MYVNLDLKPIWIICYDCSNKYPKYLTRYKFVVTLEYSAAEFLPIFTQELRFIR